ncbi:AraC family transcriptional regulator [Arachidicoccus terrestris]|uniref:AraC family transcriptional regulator n=1 Tax=Arachidicoccus terrestris TaxID=2875539 RepID=UPI001CC4439C|nr:AraC family transcriptional regulator [Arachidicoccus terrestris]UAY56872.1 AraC family transcriptional regulator [Arachidicoccus terrestris]
MPTSKHTKFPSLEEGFIGQKRIVLPPDVQNKQTSSKLIRQFFITAIGYYPNAKHHQIHRVDGAPDYIFIYCETGEGSIKVEGVQYHLRPNTYFIIPKKTAHQYKSSEEQPWTIYWAHFNGTIAGTLFKRGLGPEKGLQLQSFAFNEQIFELFDQTISMLEHNYTTAQLEVTNLNFLYFISRFVYHQQINHNLYDNDNISASIKFMKENLSKSLTLDDLAKRSGLSASHFALLFKKKMGIAPIHYFNQLKIQKSCQYLYFTTSSIKVICYELGFEDPYYFSRLFKKCMGVSPYHYRKTHNPA